MTGSLIFSIVKTKPNIAFITFVVGCFAKNLIHQYTKVLKTIMRYPKAIRSIKITYSGEKGEDLTIKEYSYFDWAGDYITRKSTSGFVFILNGGPMSWCSKKQATIALSSIEAKYVALTLAVKKVTWLRLLFIELGLFKTSEQYAEIKVF